MMTPTQGQRKKHHLQKNKQHPLIQHTNRYCIEHVHNNGITNYEFEDFSRMIIFALLIVFGCLAAGEAVIHFTQLPLPPSVFGLLFLFALLQLGWVKVKTMQALTTFLMENLSLFLLPACVAIVTHLDLIQEDIWAILFSTILSTFLVLIVTGKVHHYLRLRKRQ